MMGKAHTKVLERAAEAAGGHYGGLLLSQRHWIDKGAAGRFIRTSAHRSAALERSVGGASEGEC